MKDLVNSIKQKFQKTNENIPCGVEDNAERTSSGIPTQILIAEFVERNDPPKFKALWFAKQSWKWVKLSPQSYFQTLLLVWAGSQTDYRTGKARKTHAWASVLGLSSGEKQGLSQQMVLGELSTCIQVSEGLAERHLKSQRALKRRLSG